MTLLLVLPIAVPALASIMTAVAGWRRACAAATILGAVTVLVCGIALASRVSSGPRYGAGHLLRADALAATMLMVIGTWNDVMRLFTMAFGG